MLALRLSSIFCKAIESDVHDASISNGIDSAQREAVATWVKVLNICDDDLLEKATALTLDLILVRGGASS